MTELCPNFAEPSQHGQRGSHDEIIEDALTTAAQAEASVQSIEFGQLGGESTSGEGGNLDLLLDVQIPVSVEVGAAKIPLEEILRLVPGSIVCLDKKAEEPVDLRVNGKLVARGEVVCWWTIPTGCASRRSWM